MIAEQERVNFSSSSSRRVTFPPRAGGAFDTTRGAGRGPPRIGPHPDPSPRRGATQPKSWRQSAGQRRHVEAGSREVAQPARSLRTCRADQDAVFQHGDGRGPCRTRSPDTCRDRARSCGSRSDAPCRCPGLQPLPRLAIAAASMSTSIDGSVKGKCEARKRISPRRPRRTPCRILRHRGMAEVRLLVDHQRLDLVEHRRVRGVAVHA